MYDIAFDLHTSPLTVKSLLLHDDHNDNFCFVNRICTSRITSVPGFSIVDDSADFAACSSDRAVLSAISNWPTLHRRDITLYIFEIELCNKW